MIEDSRLAKPVERLENLMTNFDEMRTILEDITFDLEGDGYLESAEIEELMDVVQASLEEIGDNLSTLLSLIEE